MTIEFRILFDGPGFGLPDHRLSLGAFGEPLRLLLAALQRTASGIVSSASEDSEYGTRGGKFTSEASLLDLELVRLDEGCVEPSFVCTTRVPPGGQFSYVHDLAAQATEKLARDLESEANGIARSGTARRYLRSLPLGLTKQKYTVSVDGNEVFSTSFDSAALASIPLAIARLVQRRARVVGLGFEPTSIRLKIDGRSTSFQASDSQVDTALTHRHGDVTVAAIEDGEKSRIVWIRATDQAPKKVSLESTVSHIKSAWSETLRILAQ